MLENQVLLVDFSEPLTVEFTHLAQLLSQASTSCNQDLLDNYLTQFNHAGKRALVVHYFRSADVAKAALINRFSTAHIHVAVCAKPSIELELGLMSAGFHGCISQDDSVINKLQALKSALHEQIHFTPEAISRFVLHRKPSPSYQSSAKILAVTTPKEQQILSLIWNGKTNEEMALTLGISINTVKMHVQNIYKKAKIKNRGQLFALANT